MDGLLNINGAQIDRRYLIANIAWDVMVLFYVPVVVVGLRRAYRAYTGSNGKLKDLLVYWSHIAIIAFILAVVGIDPSGIFWDNSGLLNLIILGQLTILNYSSVIYTFVTSIQYYIVQSTLQVPPWVYKFKRFFLIFNFVVGNVMLITQIVIDRVWLSGLMFFFLATEGCLIAPLFIRLVLTLTRRLKEQYQSKSSEESVPSEGLLRILKAIKKLKTFTFSMCGLIYFFALLVYATYIPRLGVPKDILHSDSADFPDFARTRRFKTTFKLNWIIWVAVATSSFFIWRHWIKKSSFAGKLSARTSDKLSSTDKMSGDDNSSYTDVAQSVASQRSFTSPPQKRASDPALTYSQRRMSEQQQQRSSLWAAPPRVSAQQQRLERAASNGFSAPSPASRTTPLSRGNSARGVPMVTPTPTRLPMKPRDSTAGFNGFAMTTPAPTHFPLTGVVVEATQGNTFPRSMTAQVKRGEGLGSRSGRTAHYSPPPARSLPSRPTDVFAPTSR